MSIIILGVAIVCAFIVGVGAFVFGMAEYTRRMRAIRAEMRTEAW